MKLNADGCCGFREGIKDTAKNEDIVRCAWHETWMKAREEAAQTLELLPTDLTGGAQVYTGARWVRVWYFPLQLNSLQRTFDYLTQPVAAQEAR